MVIAASGRLLLDIYISYYHIWTLTSEMHGSDEHASIGDLSSLKVQIRSQSIVTTITNHQIRKAVRSR